jgi:N-acetylmuramoyl-L-alanine amidase
MNDLELDAGHGGADPGALGATGLQEKDLTLKLVKKVGALLAAQGFGVGYTRTTDVFVSLSGRVDLANNGKYSDFLSIHINSAASAAATGTEVFCYGLGGDAERLAKALLIPLVAAVGRANRGVKTAGFAVLHGTYMPAALIEVLFINNPTEEALLKSDAFLDKVALSIAVGYCNYKGKPYKTAAPVVPAQPATADLSKKLEAATLEADGYRLQNANLVKQVTGLTDKLTAVKNVVNS